MIKEGAECKAVGLSEDARHCRCQESASLSVSDYSDASRGARNGKVVGSRKELNLWKSPDEIEVASSPRGAN